MSLTKRLTRFIRRIRLNNAERELAFLEARCPEALDESRRQVRTLRAQLRADDLVSSADAIAKRIEKQIKKAGALA